MPQLLTLTFRCAGDLTGYLQASQQQQGTALVPFRELDPGQFTQYEAVSLAVVVVDGDKRCTIDAEVLQIVPGLGVVVSLTNTTEAEMIAAAEPAAEAQQPTVIVGEPPAKGQPKRPDSDQLRQRGMGPLSWPVERLQAEFAGLSVAEKARVARYGKRPARAVVMRSQDKALHNHMLGNSGITVDEVAALAGMAGADPALLQRICNSPEWLRHTNVVRALVCNPKLSIPQIVKLLRHLPANEARRLSKTGRVRASVKREIIKRLEGGR